MRISRRRAAQLMMTATPGIAIATQDTKPSFTSCIAATEPSLTPDERARLEKALGGLERAVKTIRDFELPRDADPAMQFRARKSRRRA